MQLHFSAFFFFFFNDTATTEIYTLSLHDALPISGLWCSRCCLAGGRCPPHQITTDGPAQYVASIRIGAPRSAVGIFHGRGDPRDRVQQPPRLKVYRRGGRLDETCL